MPQITVVNRQELFAHEGRLKDSASQAVERLRSYPEQGLDLLFKIKFEPVGRHPMEDRDLNLIEQVNQTFTYLTSFRAAHILFGLHEGLDDGLRLNLGTQSGSDIESIEPGLVAAEVFAAVRPENNRKLCKDMDKIASSGANHKYVFFYSPGYLSGRHPELEFREGVEVWVVSGMPPIKSVENHGP